MKNSQVQNKKWLPLGWKLMAAYGIFFMTLSIFVPLQSYFSLPGQPMVVYSMLDEQLTGLSWNQIIAVSPDLGLWIVLSMVSMCAMMMGLGVLTFMVARHAYKEGKRWAWKTLIIANVTPLVYYAFFIGGIYMARGTPFWTVVPGNSGLGADLFIVISAAWLFVALWLPRKELVA